MDFVFFEKVAEHDAHNGSNGTETFHDIHGSFFHQNLHYTALYVFLMILGSSVGIIGNTMVMVGILTHKKLKKLENALLFNLAIADMMVTGFVDPLLVIGAIKGQLFFYDKPLLCEITAEVCLISCYTSCFTIAAACFDRFFKICYRDLHDKIVSKLSIGILIPCLWLLAIGLVMPHQFGWGGTTYDMKNIGCVWDRQADFGYTLLFSVSLLIVLVVVSLVAVHTFCHLAHRKRMIKDFRPLVVGESYNDQDELKRLKEEYSDSVMSAKTIGIIFTTFTICWTPYAIIVSADRHDELPVPVHLFAIMIAHNNSCLNCVIYPLANKYFRQAYRQIVRKIFPCCSGMGQASEEFEGSSNLRAIKLDDILGASEQKKGLMS